ncbi:MAG: PcfB family protein [Faecalibacterium sp.]
MQEEIEQRTVNLMISTTKLTARTLLNAGRSYLQQRKTAASQGQQSLKSLLRQNRGVSSVDIEKTGIRNFKKYANKYGIDYAIRKDSSETPPRYLVFFKAQDSDALNAAFKEYSASLLNKSKRPSVLEKLHELVQIAAELPGKVRRKEQERGL